MTRSAMRFDVSEGVAQVTLAQPDRGNPIDASFCSELCDIATECDENPRIRAVLLRAEGPYFSVGADLKWLGAAREPLPRLLKASTAQLHMAMSRLSRADPPVVVAVHSLAVGGAVAFAAMADFTLAGRSARFYAAFTGIGFVCD
ncbi:MAG: enoyl-CoA hydratase/isomerase family protein, partial [Acidimicrobiia bacterium]